MLLGAGLFLSAVNLIALGSMTFNVLQGDPSELGLADVVFAIVFVVLALIGPVLALRVVRAGPAAIREPLIDAAARPLVVGGLIVLLVWIVLSGLSPT